MTLQNGLVHGDRAYLWTDTTAYHPETGENIGSMAKAFYGQLWPWAAVHSGLVPVDDPNRMARLVSERWPLSGEKLIEAAQTALRQEAGEGRPGRLLLAWFYPEIDDGPRLFMVASDALPGRAAFEPFELAAYMCGGADAEWRRDFDTNDNLAPKDMRRLIDKQIEHPTTTVQGWQGRFIGGNVVEIEVSATGVQSRLVRAHDSVVA